MSMKTMMRMMTIPGLSRDASAGEPSHGVDEERAGEPVPADEKPSRDVGDQPDESGEDSEITQPNDEELVRAISMLVQSGISESYSGMLPRPSDFNKYPADVQERMCRWNDAFTVDESNRQNQLVKAEIDQSRKGMWVSAGLFAVALLMSFISFLATSSPWSFGFLAVPVATIIANLFEPIASRSSRDRKENTEREPGKEDRQKTRDVHFMNETEDPALAVCGRGVLGSFGYVVRRVIFECGVE